MMQHFKPDNLLDTSSDGLAIIKRWEAFRSAWYVCPAGKWTIGYGTTEAVPGVSREALPGPISEDEAHRLLCRSLIRTYEPAVEEAVSVPLTQPMFSALVSFTYNVGGAALRKSTLLKRLNGRDYEGAADQLLRWKYANGKPLRGLERRRQAERELFLAPETANVFEELEPIQPDPLERFTVRPLSSRLPLAALSLAGKL